LCQEASNEILHYADFSKSLHGKNRRFHLLRMLHELRFDAINITEQSVSNDRRQVPKASQRNEERTRMPVEILLLRGGGRNRPARRRHWSRYFLTSFHSNHLSCVSSSLKPVALALRYVHLDIFLSRRNGHDGSGSFFSGLHQGEDKHQEGEDFFRHQVSVVDPEIGFPIGY
jgi:hypothetical protein